MVVEVVVVVVAAVVVMVCFNYLTVKSEGLAIWCLSVGLLHDGSIRGASRTVVQYSGQLPN